jgi:hypothetical protein
MVSTFLCVPHSQASSQWELPCANCLSQKPVKTLIYFKCILLIIIITFESKMFAFVSLLNWYKEKHWIESIFFLLKFWCFLEEFSVCKSHFLLSLLNLIPQVFLTKPDTEMCIHFQERRGLHHHCHDTSEGMVTSSRAEPEILWYKYLLALEVQLCADWTEAEKWNQMLTHWEIVLSWLPLAS